MLSNDEQLRLLLGEQIPEGGEDSETMFTDEVIDHFLSLGAGNIERAAFEGWRAKAAQFANLVDTTEGNYAKKWGQLLDNANDMVKHYQRASSGNTEGRTRIGRITRKDESNGIVSS